MADQNKYGLSRYIPEDIRREVRARSKFGCVVCRCAVYQYEHIDPEFNEAKEHDPDCMCLLCGHCHDKVTRGLLSKKTVKERYDFVRVSDAVKRPFDGLDLSSSKLTVVLGSCIFHGANTLIKLDRKIALAIEPPEEGAAFPILSGYFTDDSGNELLRIDRNIWYGPSTAWDVEVKGRVILVRPQPSVVALKLRLDPPSCIIVEHLDMRIGGSHLMLRNDFLAVGRISPEAEYYVGIERLECHGAQVGVQVDTSIDPPTQLQGLTLIGGQGIHLVGTGVQIGIGSGPMTIRGLQIEHATKRETTILTYPLTSTPLEGTMQILPPRI